MAEFLNQVLPVLVFLDQGQNLPEIKYVKNENIYYDYVFNGNLMVLNAELKCDVFLDKSPVSWHFGDKS